MSEKPPTDSAPCPSCGGGVSTAGAAGSTEWITCRHCGYGWACRVPSLKSEPLPDEGELWPGPSPATAERKSAYSMYIVCSVFWLGGAAVMVASREKVLAPPFFGVGFVVCWAATMLAGVVANVGVRLGQHESQAQAGEPDSPTEPGGADERTKPTHSERHWSGSARILIVGCLLAVLIALLLHTSRQ